MFVKGEYRVDFNCFYSDVLTHLRTGRVVLCVQGIRDIIR